MNVFRRHFPAVLNGPALKKLAMDGPAGTEEEATTLTMAGTRLCSEPPGPADQSRLSGSSQRSQLAQARALSNQAKAGFFFCLSREEQQLVEDYDTGRLDSSQEEWRTRRLEWLELVTQAEAT